LANLVEGEQEGGVRRIGDDEWHLQGCPHHGPSMDIGLDGRYHMVWFTAGDTRQGVFYAMSEDRGLSHSPPMSVGHPKRAAHPFILTSEDDRVFIVWKEFDGAESAVYLASSSDNGKSWSKSSRLASTSSGSGHPLLLQKPGSVYLSWRTDEGYYVIDVNGA